MTTVTRVASAFVYVSDHEPALRFYTERLGFEVRSDETTDHGQRWIEVAPPGEDTALALVVPGSDDQPRPGSRVEISLAVDDAEAARAEFEAHGVRVGEIMRWDPPVPPMFFLYDQDENRFLIVER
jgi:lactoylglutathione lyase